jgi:hypothetical protein
MRIISNEWLNSKIIFKILFLFILFCIGRSNQYSKTKHDFAFHETQFYSGLNNIEEFGQTTLQEDWKHDSLFVSRTSKMIYFTYPNSWSRKFDDFNCILEFTDRTSSFLRIEEDIFIEKSPLLHWEADTTIILIEEYLRRKGFIFSVEPGEFFGPTEESGNIYSSSLIRTRGKKEITATIKGSKMKILIIANSYYYKKDHSPHGYANILISPSNLYETNKDIFHTIAEGFHSSYIYSRK